MKTSTDWLRRQTAGCLALFLALSLANTAVALPQQASTQQADGAPAAPSKPQTADSGATSPGADPSQQSQPPSNANPANDKSGQSSANQQPNGSSSPVGTAAAPYEKATGVAASRPAGAAIAPAKQKRTRSFLIKTGILVGACIAVGTVVALSKASPSQPH